MPNAEGLIRCTISGNIQSHGQTEQNTNVSGEFYQHWDFILESSKHRLGPINCRNDIMRREGVWVEKPVFNPRQQQIIPPLQKFKIDDQ
jgi:hypothetical protein